MGRLGSARGQRVAAQAVPDGGAELEQARMGSSSRDQVHSRLGDCLHTVASIQRLCSLPDTVLDLHWDPGGGIRAERSCVETLTSRDLDPRVQALLSVPILLMLWKGLRVCKKRMGCSDA